MIVSIWRYSHFLLAVSSSVFITIASLTGFILAFEPVSNQLQAYKVDGSEALTLAEVMPVLRSEYEEVFTLSRDENGFITLSAINHEGDMVEGYINPFTGKVLGDIIKKAPIFEFATTLHRSLFLKSTGRFFVGLSSFLLFLIAITGIIMVVKRQPGIRHVFTAMVKNDFFSYYHVYFGRLALIPILVITITGTYLSLQRFSIIPEATSDAMLPTALNESPHVALSDIEIFKSIPLSELRKLEYPFSPDVEDLFMLHLKDRIVSVNQITGEIVQTAYYPFTQLAADWSLSWHTGRGNVWWALILGVSACSICFFIYSGFAITLKRTRIRIKNRLDKDECDYIILYGSENGSTKGFAMQLQASLIKARQKVYISELNAYTTYARLKHLIIITSTYGHGEAPSNAARFMTSFKAHPPRQSYTFAVAGFGSRSYPLFCQYAYEVEKMLFQHNGSTRVLEAGLIHNQSWEAFRQWSVQWAALVNVKLDLPVSDPMTQRKRKTVSLPVVMKTDASSHPDDTFVMELSLPKKCQLKSGDLLSVRPEADPKERLYSVAVVDKRRVLLGVKRHEKGICSNYLNDLTIGSKLKASMLHNPGFHFPEAPQVIFIATGTGIVPFLGMMAENHRKAKTYLYWGARNDKSRLLYQHYLDTFLENDRLTAFHPAYSRTSEPKTYVQDLLHRDHAFLANALQNNGVIMICGSVAMQQQVMVCLDQVCLAQNDTPLSYYQNRNQLRMDCY